ncbi:hypothetical protein ALP29_201791 [Pseudomonas syringae pv. avii]|uniref:Uncharacterized protein n=1 Tax=Pseudomonas syringae pv. avii TaxID=663959 RepID=A0A3M5VUQ4_PSESX|nr:hypothetical protein ALP29_201791 [Pseudomonas syringae pv. avii]
MQCLRVDVDGVDLRVRACNGDQQCTGARTAADVCCAFDRVRGALQVVIDRLCKAIGVGAKEDRVFIQRRECGVHQQQIIQA